VSGDKTSLWNCICDCVTRGTAFVPHPLPGALSKQTPGKEKHYENAKEYPASPLDEHLQEIYL
jgi:hypothetical protein